MSEYEDKLKFVASHLDQVNLSLGSVEAALKDLRLSSESSDSAWRSSIQSLSDRLDQAKQGSCDKGEFEEHRKSIEMRLANLEVILAYLKGKVELLEPQLKVALDRDSQQSSSLESHAKKFAEHAESISQNKDLVQQKELAAQSYADRKCKGILDEVQKALSDFRDEIKGSPSTLEGARKDLLQKFDNVALDASNALLKASYAESQFRALDRKLEAVSLQVKTLSAGG